MSDEGERTCPLCAEEMDLTDQQLKPCKCGYEICVWCWHHIMDMAEKDDTEGRCPACRSPYDKEKIVGMAANCERLVAEINMERKKSQKAKAKPSEGRKQLSSVRVIQRNLVYIVGLPLNLADEDLLQRREYFGQYGKVLKVSMSRTAAGVIQQFPNNTCSVYITYSKEEEAIRCIQSVHGFLLDGRSLKACFGTTKYCHAWLRNVPCTNSDCLYLHEIGSQEDSFTKDEIISAYTRSRVQQITGTANNTLRHSGSILPPPIDDYCLDVSSSAAKTIVKSDANQSTMNTGKGSPPNGISGRSMALPAAASWGMRASSQPQVVSSTSSNGPTKPKSDTLTGTLAFSPAVAITTQASTLHTEVVKKATWSEERQTAIGKVKLDLLKPANLHVGDCQATIPEKPAANDSTTSTPMTLSNQSSSLASKYNNMAPNITGSPVLSGQSFGPENEWTASTDGKIKDSCSDMSSMRTDGSGRGEPSGVIRTSSLSSEHGTTESPGNQGVQQPCAEQYNEPLSLAAVEKIDSSVNGAGLSREECGWRTNQLLKAVTNTVSEVEQDVISFDNQRLKDPEVVSRTTYLPNSANSIHLSNHPRSHSFQHTDALGTVNLKVDIPFVDNTVVDSSCLHMSTNSVLSNGYHEKLISSSASSDQNRGQSSLFPNEVEGQNVGRLQGDVAGLDVGESSIISNILSLELDTWDDSLTSPQNLAKLLGETDKQPNSLKISSSWKAQNNNQSRFSFARQEESRNQAFAVDSSFSAFGQLPKNRSFSQDFADSRKSYLDKFGIGNGFSSSSHEEPETFTSAPSVFSSNKNSVPRAQISAPPGFSLPHRAPPPGFSSHERIDQTFDTLSGNHLLDSSSLLRNSYQAPPVGNMGSTADIEFMDPAILAVGKGRLQGGLSNPGLDIRSNFPQQLSAFENEARLQLLMQRSLLPNQNPRFADMGDGFSSLSGSYGISSRLLDQSQMNNLTPFAQLSHQQSRNGLVSNGHWDGWNEVQGGSSPSVAELLRNDRLGLNKFYSAGYEDMKFRMPSSGDLYNRTFEM